jgi:hypothetical protein
MLREKERWSGLVRKAVDRSIRGVVVVCAFVKTVLCLAKLCLGSANRVEKRVVEEGMRAETCRD